MGTYFWHFRALKLLVLKINLTYCTPCNSKREATYVRTNWGQLISIFEFQNSSVSLDFSIFELYSSVQKSKTWIKCPLFTKMKVVPFKTNWGQFFETKYLSFFKALEMSKIIFISRLRVPGLLIEYVYI